MTIEELKNSNLLIFDGIVGSHAYGLNTPESDIDMKGVYIQPMDDILSFGYIEQVTDEKNDKTYYELKRFLELLKTNNPNILELLTLPERFVQYKHPLWTKYIENNVDKFITKSCKNSFSGYAISQIKKARGLNKKIVNPIDKEKKTPLDFCYVHSGYNSIPLLKWLKNNNLKQKYCGVSNVPHSRDLYALYYDYTSYIKFENVNCLRVIGNWKNDTTIKDKSKIKPLYYKGIIKETETGELLSNEIRMSNIPIDERDNVICHFSYNKDGYTSYCKDYKEYWEWVEKRNPARYENNIKHGKQFDSKNMSHCHRLLDMSIEIAQGKGIIVYRENKDELMKIRRGELEYDQLIESAENKVKISDELFEKCNLPDKIDDNFINDILLNMRKEFYNF